MDPAAADFSGINWLGVGLAVVANMVIGMFWYSPMSPTGKVWMKHTMGGAAPTPDMKPSPGVMARSFALAALGAFLTMFVLAHDFWVYQDAFRNTATGGTPAYSLGVADGLAGGFFTWLGFFVPPQLATVSWEGKPWSLFTINAGYYLVTLLLAGVLLVTIGDVG